ncbi:MFS transporter [Fodinisporobacter ferrooxydans]|uniref:MFS transporter n=1 Tax=Fodinisporobacter ferrooxydans TaxID=2901836 RepID=A0ABY4CPX4_9BACL|nr:MFS transporter [Alicyclobacillaceae bacterium MYW30-H2]
MNGNIPAARWWRIIPVAFLMYTIAFMDRNNVGFGFAGMEKDLGIGATYAGLAGGIFFFGYLFLQIPGGLLAEKWSAKKFVTIALLVWGIFAIMTGFVQNLTELLVVRFLLGVAEGGVWPATLVMLSKWFPLNERARANSYWMLCIPVASLVMSPISGWILTHSDWRTMFMIEGLPPFLWAAIWWFFIAEDPSKAKWISKEEREYLEKTLAAEKQTMNKQATSFKDALKNRNVLLLVLVYFLIQIGFYGYGLWLPTVVKSISHGNNMTVGIISALPWLAAIFGLIINSKHSDKTGERKGHVAIAVIVGGIFLLISALIGKSNPALSIAALILCMGFMDSYNGVFWAIPAQFLSDEVLGAAMGLINAIGNLGGFFGPFIVGYLISQTHSFMAGMIFLVAALILSGILILRVRYDKSEPLASSTANKNPLKY